MSGTYLDLHEVSLILPVTWKLIEKSLDFSSSSNAQNNFISFIN